MKFLLMILIINSVYSNEISISEFKGLKVETANTQSSIYGGFRGSSPLTGSFINEDISLLFLFNTALNLDNRNYKAVDMDYSFYIKMFNISFGYEKIRNIKIKNTLHEGEFIHYSNFPIKIYFEYGNFIFGLGTKIINSLQSSSYKFSKDFLSIEKLEKSLEFKGFKTDFGIAFSSSFGIFDISIENLFNKLYLEIDCLKELYARRLVNLSYNNQIKPGVIFNSLTFSIEFNDLLNNSEFFNKIKISTESKFRFLFLDSYIRAGIKNLSPVVGSGISLGGLMINYDYSNNYFIGKLDKFHIFSISFGYF